MSRSDLYFHRTPATPFYTGCLKNGIFPDALNDYPTLR